VQKVSQLINSGNALKYAQKGNKKMEKMKKKVRKSGNNVEQH